MSNGRLAASVLAVATAAYASAALAYVGPGAGLGMIASVFAMVLAFLATIVGIILWPIRKLRQRGRKAAGGREPPKAGDDG